MLRLFQLIHFLISSIFVGKPIKGKAVTSASFDDACFFKAFCLYSFNVCCASAAVAKLDTIMKYFGFAVVASALFCAGTEAEDAVAVTGVVLRATVFPL